MEDVRFAYKRDIFGNDIFARVAWSRDDEVHSRSIALIYHAGGVVTGSCDVIPLPQIQHLCSAGFVVVMPNYRLAPQVTAKEAFQDSEDAFEWTITTLSSLLASKHSIEVDTARIVAMGHSSGGTMVLHLASLGKPLKAVLALYPFLFVSDLSTNAQRGASSDDFKGIMTAAQGRETNDGFDKDEWQVITPTDKQISESPFNLEVRDPAQLTPRDRWVIQIFQEGKWIDTLQPDGDFISIDPMTRLNERWPPVMLIHGSEDNVPGRSEILMRRAADEMKIAGIKEVQLEIIQAGHVFDHMNGVGTTDFGAKWQAVLRGLDWLIKWA